MGRHFTDHSLFGHRRGEDHHHHHRGGGRGFGHRMAEGFAGDAERGGRGGGRRGRLFDYGELRLLVLALLAEQPAHGYELIKGIEERFGGSYSPSPGVIYPTLSWLEDMGYTAIEPSDGARKRHSVTAEGTAFLDANRAAADALLARSAGAAGRPGVPAPVIRAMENLKLAMRLRFRDGPVDEAAADAIAAAIDEAARIVEKSR
ncbi:PadR family transcriptional regulator [Sphingobium sufflavum]|uniref:PadR family transcriptional regulator n=1 Tax=Sphingobium sufflavum TaxID=1129547 RepID=UPI001F41BB19|nr:PadR family transcriptional regulator [Sphingobium sufflavum]MCE7794963.1 PadR family transcriptional regulator [Sphingobium sufflavum]